MTDSFFFDSYAIIEFLRGNPSYSRFSSVSPVTTKLNLFEVCCALLREAPVQRAGGFLWNYWSFATDFNESVVLEAAVLRLKLKGRKLSMTDCIGYVLSRHLGMRFLTGDEQFKDLPNVEFVK